LIVRPVQAVERPKKDRPAVGVPSGLH
jgi:hypothetical protein